MLLRSLGKHPASSMKSPSGHWAKRDSEPFQVQGEEIRRQAKGSQAKPHRHGIRNQPGASCNHRTAAQGRAPRCSCCSNRRCTSTPSAQAALGTLFCNVAGRERRLVIETHSDHLLDRVRHGRTRRLRQVEARRRFHFVLRAPRPDCRRSHSLPPIGRRGKRLGSSGRLPKFFPGRNSEVAVEETACGGLRNVRHS